MAGVAYSAAFVSAFTSLFDGQRSVYATGGGQIVREPVDERLIREHLEGRQRVGIYCIAGPGADLCKWACVDVEASSADKGWDRALLIARRLEKTYGLAAHVERSKGRGWHVWVFFARYVDAWRVRAVVRMAIGDVADQVEVPVELVPEHDVVVAEPAGLHGRFVWLPMFGGDVADGRTCFHVDVAGKPKLDDGWSPERAATNEEAKLDLVLDGVDRAPMWTPYDRGADEAPPERRLDALHLCATRMLKDGARGAAVADKAKYLAVHLRRNGFTLTHATDLLGHWNSYLCIPPLADDALTAIVTAAYDPRGGPGDLGCDHPSIVPCCVKAECPVWRAARSKTSAEASGTGDPEVVQFIDGKGEPTMREHRLARGDIHYTVAGLDNTRGSLHAVPLMIERGKTLLYRANCNLDSPRGRREVENEVFRAHKVAGIARDLMNVANLISARIAESVQERVAAEERLRQGYAITKDEVDKALAFAKSTKDILYKMIEFTSKHGLVREKKNRGLLYLLATSRLMPSPISGIGKGDSAAGKSHVASAIFKLIPKEDLVEYTRITAAALFYRGEYSLMHKLFFVREAPGSEGSEHSLRTFMTEGDLQLSTVQKDDSGKLTTVDTKVYGPMAFYTTTTQVEINPENETRLMQINADETEEMTEAIKGPQVWSAMHGSISPTDDELKIWQNFQRVLEKGLEVVIPFADRLRAGFPSNALRSRRDFGRMLDLIKACAYLHQYHRKRLPGVGKVEEGSGSEKSVTEKPKEWIVASVADYAIVKSLVEASIMRSSMDVKSGQDEMLRWLRELTEQAFGNRSRGEKMQTGMEVHSDDEGDVVWISTPLLRKTLGKTQRAVMNLVKSLEDEGIVALMPNRRPTWVRLGDKVGDGEITLPTVSPEELFKDYPEDRAHMYDPLSAPDFDDIYKMR